MFIVELKRTNFNDGFGGLVFKNSKATFDGELTNRFIKAILVSGWGYTVKKKRKARKKK